MASYKDFKKCLLEDPQVKAAYDALQPEFDRIQAAIDAEKSQRQIQKETLENVSKK